MQGNMQGNMQERVLHACMIEPINWIQINECVYLVFIFLSVRAFIYTCVRVCWSRFATPDKK